MPPLDVHLTADGGSVAAARAGVVAAEGRLRRARGGWELVAAATAEAPQDSEAVTAVLDRLLALARRTGDDPVRWLVSVPTAATDAAAEAVGLTHRRDLLQMRRPLPVDDAARDGIEPPATRPFRPGVDEEAWLAVNNRSFAGHPDQSGQTLADVRALEAQPWFDPAGFLLLDADPAGPRAGALDGFCWTKVHPPAPGGGDPAMGEIFVIGVDPSAQGRHLGPALTVAGLDHLAGRGLTVGLLYVDLANAGAVRMYERLGFTTHHVDRIYADRVHADRPATGR